MKDRLIELIKKRFAELIKDGDWSFGEMVVNVADHLLANGVIVPPCNVGDTVYYLDDIVWDDECHDVKEL